MKVPMRGLGAGIAFVCAMALAGCKPDAAIQKSAVIGRGTKEPQPPPALPRNLNEPETPVAALDPSTLGTVRGVINFNGKAPAKIRIDTSMDPACGVGGAGPVYSEQYLVNAGKLGNVFVYVKTGPPALDDVPASAQPAVLDQKHCQYVPHVVAVMRGGYVEFTNSDSTMHNIHTMPTVVGNETIDVSQGPHGAAVSKQMTVAEAMIPVRCNNHPWMNAFLNVAPTPFFAISDATGQFEMHGLPPGTYTIGAVHEKLGERTITVTVTPRTVTKADFAFSVK
jgi:plastocyanin